jgi:hypothetical protein
MGYRGHAKWSTAGWIVALLMLYVLSYAPLVRCCAGRAKLAPPRCGPPWITDFDTSTLIIYHPVEWLIDNTPAHEPLDQWAELWGAYEVIYVNGINRMQRRGYTFCWP